MRRRPTPTVALALASAFAVLLGTAGALGASRGAPDRDLGRAPTEAIAATPTSPPPTAPPAGAVADARPGAGAAPPAVPEVGVRSGRLEDLPAPAPAPSRVRVPGLGIDAPVVAVGVEEGTAAVAVPDDVGVAGWYRFGPTPGAPGSAVLTAHVDSASQGAGAFFPLREAEPGTTVTVELADGTQRDFVVVGRRSYPKAALPAAELFARDGAPVLTLITCGGAFDPATRSYEENLVVFAEPVGA